MSKWKAFIQDEDAKVLEETVIRSWATAKSIVDSAFYDYEIPVRLTLRSPDGTYHDVYDSTGAENLGANHISEVRARIFDAVLAESEPR